MSALTAVRSARSYPLPGRLRATRSFLVVAGLALLGWGRPSLSLESPAPAAPPAALIYAGWFGNTMPTPSFVRTNLAFLETQPFDGLVVYLRDPGMTLNLSTGIMSSTPHSYEAIASVMSPLVGLPFGRLTENLALVFGSTPPDFFDDWSVTLQNFANLARAAKDSGLKGVCFDNEQYFSPWGSYWSARYAPGRSLAEYQAQARLRGRQVMEAMVAQFPSVVVLTLHGPYISEPKAPASLAFPQWQTGNELLGPFFAGFMEGVGSSALNVDGGELYTLRTEAQFQASASWRRHDLCSDAVNCAFIPASLRPLWPGRTSIAFGVYDQPFGGADMNPVLLRSTLSNALRQADRFVWFYAEGPTFLLPPSLGGASAVWVDAVRQGKADAGTVVGTAPAAPINLAASTVSSSEIGLSWWDMSSDETAFEIERRTAAGGSWSRVLSTAANVSSMNDTGLAPGTSYVYRVRAVNGASPSPYSNEAAAATASPVLPPAAPDALLAVQQPTSGVRLTWTDASSNEDQFLIERRTGTVGGWTQIGMVGANSTAFVDAGTIPRQRYSYRVRARNSAGFSPYSNEVVVRYR